MYVPEKGDSVTHSTAPVQAIKPHWIDFNGHLNMAYYNVLFDRGMDHFFDAWGLGEAYRERTGSTTYSAEAHVKYLRELHLDDPVQVRLRLLDYDAKRIHTFAWLHHAEEGWVAATCEVMTLHVDQTAPNGPKVAPMPETITQALATTAEAEAPLGAVEEAGRPMAIRR